MATEIVALNANGIERRERAIVVIQPRANAQFQKNSAAPLAVNFLWSKHNFLNGEMLRLEIAEDRNFARIVQTIEYVDNTTETVLGGGLWHWRLSVDDTILFVGHFTIIDNFAEAVLEEPAPEVTEAPPDPVREASPVVRQPVPAPPTQLLPVPLNMRPVNGYRIGIEELKTQRNIDFSWSPVQGANAYILTLYQQSANGQRRLIRRETVSRTRWTLDNLSDLDIGTFVWQLEAVSQGRAGTVERRGNVGENSFILDIPLPNAPKVKVEEVTQ